LISLSRGSLEAESCGAGAHGGDAVGDVVVEGISSSAAPLIMSSRLDATRESFVLHLFPHAGGVDIVDRLCGLDQRAGGEESGELVAGEESLGELRGARTPE